MTTTPTNSREGHTLDTIAANGLTDSTATVIGRSCGFTVVVVTCSSNNAGVKLPDGADIGDVVEIHNADTSISVGVFGSNDGTLIAGVISGDSFGISPLSMNQFRKLDSSTWGRR